MLQCPAGINRCLMIQTFLLNQPIILHYNHSKFVVFPMDKASNNIVFFLGFFFFFFFFCFFFFFFYKTHYFSRLKEELGMSTTTGNPTYKLTTLSWKEMLKTTIRLWSHLEFLSLMKVLTFLNYTGFLNCTRILTNNSTLRAHLSAHISTSHRF